MNAAHQKTTRTVDDRERDAMSRQLLRFCQVIAGWAPDTKRQRQPVQLLNKDPRGGQEFVDHLSQHSAQGASLTMRNYQGQRPSLYDFEKQFSALTIPTLIMVGDEHDACLDPSVFLKRTIPTAGLFVQPRTGHAINLEEPAVFNREVQEFLSTVERGRWGRRDPQAVVSVHTQR